jgi:KDO2-lipid IV(A) lauroyltransferase
MPSTSVSRPISAPPRRWHTHGWNLPISWRLMLTITPRLPRPALVPLHHLTTLLCFACMRRERSAARRNLQRVTGARGLAAWRLAYRLFYNFSRFMVAYGELRRPGIEHLLDRLDGAEEADARLRQALAGGRGAILLTMHLGQWDLGLKLLSRYRLPVHVVMQSTEGPEVRRFAEEARRFAGLSVHQTGDSIMLGVELARALGRGELVAMQGDRPAGAGIMEVPFFGAPAPLPTGPLVLAMATGAPLLPVFVILGRGRRYRLLALEPMRFERRQEAGPEELRASMRRLAAALESVVTLHPDQWFNFYDVWPETAGRGAAGPPAATARVPAGAGR